MPRTHFLILNHPAVRTALAQAWEDSNPGEFGGHEEGGFVLQDATDVFSVVRWPQGKQDQIVVPPHKDCRIAQAEIVASFHTHPNTGSDYLQEPSETDKRAVRDDPNLKGGNYVGEFVISLETIYLITPNGQVRELSDTASILVDE